MANIVHLPNAPITEAIVQVQCSLPDDHDIERFATCHTEFSDDYPQGEPIAEGSVKIEFKAGRPIKLDQFVDQSAGYKFTSSDELEIAFFRRSSFSFSRLAPYTDWTDFQAKARSMWERYRTCVETFEATRVSMRFINRLELPIPLLDFDEYLTCGPQVPDGLPQGVAHYVTRLHIPAPDCNALILLSQTMGTPRDDMHVPVLLDVDVQRECEPSRLSDEEIWSILETLRQLKNDVFFASVTEKLVELYK